MWSVLCLNTSQIIYSHHHSPIVAYMPVHAPHKYAGVTTSLLKLFRGFPPHSPLGSSPETFTDPQGPPWFCLCQPPSLTSDTSPCSHFSLTGLPLVPRTWSAPLRWTRPPNKLFPLPGTRFPTLHLANFYWSFQIQLHHHCYMELHVKTLLKYYKYFSDP